MLYELLTHVSAVRASNFIAKKSPLNPRFVMLTTITTEIVLFCCRFRQKCQPDMKCILARELYNVDCLESDSKTLQFIYGPATLGINLLLFPTYFFKSNIYVKRLFSKIQYLKEL